MLYWYINRLHILGIKKVQMVKNVGHKKWYIHKKVYQMRTFSKIRKCSHSAIPSSLADSPIMTDCFFNRIINEEIFPLGRIRVDST